MLKGVLGLGYGLWSGFQRRHTTMPASLDVPDVPDAWEYHNRQARLCGCCGWALVLGGQTEALQLNPSDRSNFLTQMP